jgi:hypothetical protein
MLFRNKFEFSSYADFFIWILKPTRVLFSVKSARYGARDSSFLLILCSRIPSQESSIIFFPSKDEPYLQVTIFHPIDAPKMVFSIKRIFSEMRFSWVQDASSIARVSAVRTRNLILYMRHSAVRFFILNGAFLSSCCSPPPQTEKTP